MKANSKNIKSCIFGISTIILLVSSGFAMISSRMSNSRTNKNISEINISNMTKKVKIPDSSILYSQLSEISNYIDIVQTKQQTLLKDLNHSAFHTIQKHSAIKHRYFTVANRIIKDSNTTLKTENKKIKSILSIIKIHPYNYQDYLSYHGYIIPNMTFFINSHSTQDKNVTKINNNSYKMNKATELNNITFSTEEATIGAKKLAYFNADVIVASCKDYNFKAKIIGYNYKNNSFQFMKYENRISKNKKGIVKNNDTNKTKFLSSESENNNTVKKHKTKIILTNIFSNTNYSNNINLHSNECFRTYINYKNIRSVNRNRAAYIFIPIACFTIAETLFFGYLNNTVRFQMNQIKLLIKRRMRMTRIYQEYAKAKRRRATINYIRFQRNADLYKAKYTEYVDHIHADSSESGRVDIRGFINNRYYVQLNGGRSFESENSLHGIRKVLEDDDTFKIGDYLTTFSITEKTHTLSRSTSRHISVVNSKSDSDTLHANIENENYKLIFTRLGHGDNTYITKFIQERTLKDGNKVQVIEIEPLNVGDSEYVQDDEEEDSVVSKERVVLKKYIDITDFLEKTYDYDSIHLPILKGLNLNVLTTDDFAIVA